MLFKTIKVIILLIVTILMVTFYDFISTDYSLNYYESLVLLLLTFILLNQRGMTDE